MENTVKNTGKEKSDMLTMLENLERMFDAIRCCVNTHAYASMLMAMAIETETLALKLQLILRRWVVYLPFKECCDVDFQAWEKKVNDWYQLFDINGQDLNERYPSFKPSCSFWLDLFGLEVKYPGLSTELKDPLVLRPDETDDDYNYLDPYQYNARLSLLEDDMTDDMYFYDSISSDCANILKERCKQSRLRLFFKDESVQEAICKETETMFNLGTTELKAQECCCDALLYLHCWLENIQLFFISQLSNDLFVRFCNFVRVDFNSYGDSWFKINQWKNSWPQSAITKKAQQKKEQLQEQLRGTRWGKELEEYVNLDAPMLTNNADFGRFVFKNRKELLENELKEIDLLCCEICDLNEIIHQKEEKMPDDPAQPSQPRKLNKVEQQILDQLMDLAEKGDWTQGATVESIQAGLKRALGVGDPLPKELQSQSEQLWVLFKKRDGCDAEKSLRVTWLNIAGWCVKKGILKGGTDNDICKRFFPNCGDKDYMNVSRGRKDSVKTFVEIHKLLETCLLPKQS